MTEKREDQQQRTSATLHSSSITKGTEKLELICRHLSFTVPLEGKYREAAGGAKEKVILSEIDGIFRPGRLTAVMGSSGAGKTTLMSILAGNANSGTVSGDILVNGEVYDPKMLKELGGFVFQDDVLLPTMTVKEALRMSALLRLPKSVSREERERRVEEVISLLHLTDAQNTVVGDPMKKGISGGERKRTAIGMEMVINPGILFLDEPTTGLDTFTAFAVIMSLRRLAELGRTVIATIHQPSTEIFNLFDDLLILSRGKVAYFGSATEAVDYFAANGYQCPQYINPSDYIFMQVLREFGVIDEDEEEQEEENIVRSEQSSFISRDSAAGTAPAAPVLSKESKEIKRNAQETCDERIETLLTTWETSDQNENIKREIVKPQKKTISVSILRKRAPFWTQFKYLFKRAGLNFLRNRQLIIARFAQAIFLGLILGLVFLNSNQYSVPVQIRNKSGALFFIATNVFFAASTQILSIFGIEKPVFYREYQGGYYSVSAYYISKTIIEIPGQIVGPFLMVIICYYMIGLNPAFSDYLLVATLAALGALCGNAYGTLLVAIVDDLNIALSIAPITILPLFVVSGIFVASLPDYINWLKYISPIYYSFSGMLQTEFSRIFPNCDPNREYCRGDRALSDLNFEATFAPGVDIVFLLLIFSILWVAGWIALSIGARRHT